MDATAGRSDSRIALSAAIAIAYGFPLVRLLFPHAPADLANVHQDIQTIVVEWFFTLLVLATWIFGAHKNLRDVGFRLPHGRDYLAMLATFAGIFIVSGIVVGLLGPPKLESHSVTAVPLAIRIALVLTAGLCEEFLFRGIGVEALTLLTGKRWLAGLCAVLFFGLAHIGRYGFNAKLALPTAIGALLTLLYLWRRNLPACIALHAIIDGIFLLLVPALTHH